MRRPEPSPVLPVPERKLPKPSLTRNLPGLTVVAFGLAMASVAVTYPLGSLLRPGPGFFPLVIALILAALGVEVERGVANAGLRGEVLVTGAGVGHRNCLLSEKKAYTLDIRQYMRINGYTSV